MVSPRALCPRVPRIAQLAIPLGLLATLLVLAHAQPSAAQPPQAPAPAPAAATIAAPAAVPTAAPAPAPAPQGAALDPKADFLEAWPSIGKPYNVCVAQNALPWSYCTTKKNSTWVAPSSADAGGVEVNTARQVLEAAGWTYGDFQFLCFPNAAAVLADLSSANPVCMMGAEGLDVTEAVLESGVRFSPVPTFYSGLVVLAPGSVQKGGMWFFVKPFTLEVWMTWLIICLIMMVVFYLVEISTADEKNLYCNGATGMWDCFYEANFKSVNRKGPKVSEEVSYPAKVLVVFYSFFLLIFWQLYTAQLAGLQSAQFITSGVSDVTTIQTGSGQYYVITPDTIYDQVVQPPVNIPATAVNWTVPGVADYYLRLMDGSGKTNAIDQELIAAGLVGTRKPDALIIDYGAAVMYQDEYCNLYIQGKPFQTTANAVAFPRTAPAKGIAAFATLLAGVQKKTGILDDIEGKIKSALAKDVYSDDFNAPYCKNKQYSKVKGDPSAVTFTQISGLLVIVGIGAGIGMIWSAYLIYKKREWHRQHFQQVVDEVKKMK